MRSGVLNKKMRLNNHKCCDVTRVRPNIESNYVKCGYDGYHNWRSVDGQRVKTHRSHPKCVANYVISSYYGGTCSVGMQSWYCQDCGVSVCLDCCIYYGTFDPETIKTIYGQTYVRFNEEGAKSLHFSEKIEGEPESGSYIFQIYSEISPDDEDGMEPDSDLTL